ncbi:hypothetical protein [Streptomyces sp. UNOC14_S4]|uniref:hypothetical protein n=1 Tax=Streptomyces sp. UNOC14_S4 TaxID=2872340 RepID=UPI001E3A16E8|nr:hypothetical protein [Streptomyces sp. UNOC14_S4]MCC3769839.1 hypothetical protein [Streptomyces sp. UNOC14_S4]
MRTSQKPPNRRRTLAGAAVAAVLAGAGTVLAAPPALADTVPVQYTCTGPGAPAGVQSLQVAVTAPDEVHQGTTASVSADVITTITAPIDLPAGSVTGELTLDLGGAGTGSVTATGFSNADVVPSGTPVSVTGGKVPVQFHAVGPTTFSPGSASVHVFGITVECAISGTAPVAATTRVLAS